MAHRASRREIFRMICIAAFFTESERTPTPAGNSAIFDSSDIFTNDSPQLLTIGPLNQSSSSTSDFLNVLLEILALLPVILIDQATTRAPASSGARSKDLSRVDNGIFSNKELVDQLIMLHLQIMLRL